MTDQSKKISQLPTAANIASTDRVLVLRDPAGNASVRTVTVNTFVNQLSVSIVSNTVPVSASSNGTAGSIAYDSNRLYICVATNTWRKVNFDQLSPW